jgi:hypothetical protein
MLRLIARNKGVVQSTAWIVTNAKPGPRPADVCHCAWYC